MAKKGRQVVTSSLATETIRAINELSDRTGLAKGKVIDKAVKLLLEKEQQ